MGTTPVVIDNTNTQKWEFKPYVSMVSRTSMLSRSVHMASQSVPLASELLVPGLNLFETRGSLFHNSDKEGYSDEYFLFFHENVSGAHKKHSVEALPMSTTTYVFVEK